jgi:hypothetical protein
MLWYKSWLETRWRFLIGLALLMCAATWFVFLYPRVAKFVPLMSNADAGGEFKQQIREATEMMRTYRGYVWSQWFYSNLAFLISIFAVVLGTGGLLSQASRGGALFTLSMPASRNRIVSVRAATGLGELLVLAFVPSLLFPLLSPLVGQSYGIGDVLVHSGGMFVEGAVLFSATFLLSTVFSDVWRPLLIVLCAARFLDMTRFGLSEIVSAESYFRGGGVPWLGLLAIAAASAAMLCGAVANISRRDF